MSHNPKQSESKAWKYFKRVENSEAAKCKKCLAIMKCKGCTTSALLHHIEL